MSCLEKKKAIWPGIIQQPVNAGSRRTGVKTPKPVIVCRTPRVRVV